LLVLFIALGTPKYIGPDELIPLNKASIEQLIKRNGGKNVKEASSWVVYFYADWNENCLQHDALVAQLSLEFTSASLKFGKVDCNRFPDAAKEYNIELNSTSWQLPTFILFHKGEIVSRLPGFDSNGKVVKTILDRVSFSAFTPTVNLSDYLYVYYIGWNYSCFSFKRVK
jgi:thioredoxin-like negative regulator of GroEL